MSTKGWEGWEVRLEPPPSGDHDEKSTYPSIKPVRRMEGPREPYAIYIRACQSLAGMYLFRAVIFATFTKEQVEISPKEWLVLRLFGIVGSMVFEEGEIGQIDRDDLSFVSIPDDWKDQIEAWIETQAGGP